MRWKVARKIDTKDAVGSVGGYIVSNQQFHVIFGLGDNVRSGSNRYQILFFIMQFNPCDGNLVANSERVATGNEVSAYSRS